MAGHRRANKTEIQYRLDALNGLRARGVPSYQLVQVACQQWGVSERQAKRYVQMAREQMLEEAQQPIEQQYGQIWFQYHYIYQQAILTGDLKLALRTCSSRARLLKQYKQAADKGAVDPRPSWSQRQMDMQKLLEEMKKAMEEEEESA